jgi:hypothetical protein
MKHYSKILNETISIGSVPEEGLVHYTDRELEIVKSLRKTIKSDTEFAQAVRLAHEVKRNLGGVLKDWEIPFWEKLEEKEKPNATRASESGSFWTQIQDDYSKNIAKEIKSRTKAGRSVTRLKGLLASELPQSFKK